MALSRFEDSKGEMVSGGNLDLVSLELQSQTYDIHPGWLFEPVGNITMRELCTALGATGKHPDRTYAHWTDFADHLGNSDEGEPYVTREQQMNIENDFQVKNGSVWWVFATFVQWDDARLSTVITVLKEIDRMDIISRIHDPVYRLVQYVHDHAEKDPTSGIFKPRHVPWVPFILRPPRSEISKHFEIENITSTVSIPEQSHNSELRITKRVNTPYALIVMLTFASDGKEAAYRLARIFRSHEPRIGVLILSEQLEHVFVGGTQFISECFEQVDNIVPILTSGYFDSIKSCPNRTDELDSAYTKDEKYVKFIFQSFTEEFTDNRCKNYRVRPIVPDETQSFSGRRLHISLKAWFREPEIQDFISHLLREKSRRQKSHA